VKKLHLIFVPGLGDHMPTVQRWAVRTWSWYGVETELFRMNWADNVTWETKFQHLLQRIDRLSKQGKQVGLVGASAGAAAVINAYAARPDTVSGVICIAGKINHPETIGERYRRQNPSFIACAEATPAALASLGRSERRRIQCRYALFDETVRTVDSIIPGAHNRRVFSFGHALTIGSQLTFGPPSFIRFLKKLT
jgi:pimeloyl-ACP methyl ester carboxylesterase